MCQCCCPQVGLTEAAVTRETNHRFVIMICMIVSESTRIDACLRLLYAEDHESEIRSLRRCQPPEGLCKRAQRLSPRLTPFLGRPSLPSCPRSRSTIS